MLLIIPAQAKMAVLSMRLILLAILLYELFIHHKQNLGENTFIYCSSITVVHVHISGRKI